MCHRRLCCHAHPSMQQQCATPFPPPPPPPHPSQEERLAAHPPPATNAPREGAHHPYLSTPAMCHAPQHSMRAQHQTPPTTTHTSCARLIAVVFVLCHAPATHHTWACQPPSSLFVAGEQQQACLSHDTAIPSVVCHASLATHDQTAERAHFVLVGAPFARTVPCTAVHRAGFLLSWFLGTQTHTQHSFFVWQCAILTSALGPLHPPNPHRCVVGAVHTLWQHPEL